MRGSALYGGMSMTGGAAHTSTVCCLAAWLCAVAVICSAETLGPVGGWPCPEHIPDELCVESGQFAAGGQTEEERLLPLEDTVAHVRSLLQTAIKVELSTIPVYLTTMYSIVNQSSFCLLYTSPSPRDS